MLPQLSLFKQCSIQSQDVMQTWLHWRRQDALLVQKHFMALFHPKPNECLRFDLESCNLMCTYTVVVHPCHIPSLAQARPMMLCIYTSIRIKTVCPVRPTIYRIFKLNERIRFCTRATCTLSARDRLRLEQ